MFEASKRIPVVGETVDPWIFLLLLGLAGSTTVGVMFAGEVFPNEPEKDARSHVIQLAAGLIVLLGAYFTAVNIREARAQQAFDRLSKVIDQLASESDAVRMGAIRLLEGLAMERLDLPSGSYGHTARLARQNAIRDALGALASEPRDSPVRASARRVLAAIQADHTSGSPLRSAP